jgi:hypothetical protein
MRRPWARQVSASPPLASPFCAPPTGAGGAAVAFDDTLALTCGHLLPAQPGPLLLLQRGDGVREGPAQLLARSPRLDLAVLRIPAGLLQAPPLASGGPRSGNASGPPGRPAWAPASPHAIVDGPGVFASV